MICYQMKSQTDQLNLRISVAIIERLSKLAEKFRGDTKKRNEIAVDVLENYLDHWEQAAQMKQNIIRQQLQNQLEALDVTRATGEIEKRKSENANKLKKPA